MDGCMAARCVAGLVWILMVGVAPGCVAEKGPLSPIFAPALKPGDKIAFVAPAGTLDRTRMELVRSRLEERGFEVSVPDDLYRRRGYLAGDDDVRVRELMAAFEDPDVRAIFPGTGGYGATRILDRIDYDVIRRNPKILVGFSDITALHLAIQAKTGLVSFHSPNPMWGLGSPDNLHPFSARYFWRALLQEQYAPPEDEAPPVGYVLEIPADVAPVEVMSPGVGRGRLTGGNLSLVAALIGTPYEIDTDGRVLLLEDVGERPYRIDRCLCQLRLAGKLDNLAGVILGQFSDCDPKDAEESLSLDQVLLDYFAPLGVPVIRNFPVGHARHNATLPIGALVEVDADSGRVSVLENPVQLPCD